MSDIFKGSSSTTTGNSNKKDEEEEVASDEDVENQSGSDSEVRKIDRKYKLDDYDDEGKHNGLQVF